MKTTKTIIMSLAVLAGALSITSCNKEWTCSCTYSGGGKEDIPLQGSMKRSAAKRLCESQFNAPSQGTNCKLK